VIAPPTEGVDEFVLLVLVHVGHLADRRFTVVDNFLSNAQPLVQAAAGQGGACGRGFSRS